MNNINKDIEILENMLNKESYIYKRNKRGNKEIKFEVNSNYYKALENLIKGYRELEEGNTYLKTHILTPTTIKLNYIPKSKIEEKIEELETKKNKYGFGSIESIIFLNKIQVLQELLGDEE